MLRENTEAISIFLFIISSFRSKCDKNMNWNMCALLMASRSDFIVSFISLVVGCHLTSAVLLNEAQWIHVSRCRAQCLSELTDETFSDSICTEDQQCDLCWKLCERQTVTEWVSLCTPSTEQICPIGCQTACSFIQTATFDKFDTDFNSLYHFPGIPDVVGIGDDQLRITWGPVTSPELGQFQAIVYSLFWKDDKHPEWSHVSSTSSLSTRVTGPHQTFPSLAFKLVAINIDGPLAEEYPPYPPTTIIDDEDYSPDEYYYYYYYYEEGNNNPFHDSSQTYDKIETTTTEVPLEDDEEVLPTTQGPKMTSAKPFHRKPVSPLRLRISVSFSTEATHELLVRVTWTTDEDHQNMTALVIPRGCTVDLQCTSEEEGFATIAPASNETVWKATFSNLTYNAQYAVRIISGEGRSHIVYFLTPTCQQYISNMTVCMEKPKVSTRKRYPSQNITAPVFEDNPSHVTYVMLATAAAILIAVITLVVIALKRHIQLKKSLLDKVSSIQNKALGYIPSESLQGDVVDEPFPSSRSTLSTSPFNISSTSTLMTSQETKIVLPTSPTSLTQGGAVVLLADTDGQSHCVDV